MKYSVIILILMITSSFIYGQRNYNRNSDLIFKNYSHNFGNLDYLVDATHKFIFKNKGDKAVVIDNVKAKCGCTAAKWTQKPVKPGEKGFIKIDYDTSIPGKFFKSIFVFTNTDNKYIKLNISGKVSIPEKGDKNYEKYLKKHKN